MLRSLLAAISQFLPVISKLQIQHRTTQNRIPCNLLTAAITGAENTLHLAGKGINADQAQALVCHGITVDPVSAAPGTIAVQALVPHGTTIDPVSAVHGTIVDQALTAHGITTTQASVCPGVIIMAAAGAGEIKGWSMPAVN